MQVVEDGRWKVGGGERRNGDRMGSHGFLDLDIVRHLQMHTADRDDIIDRPSEMRCHVMTLENVQLASLLIAPLLDTRWICASKYRRS